MYTILYSLLILGVTGCLAAVLLYFVAQKFKVEEDPRIDLIQEVLPGANCGGCGFAGCRNFADACVKDPSLKGLLCPVGGEPTMAKVTEILAQGGGAAAPAEAKKPADGKFDPAIAAKIAALPTPKAAFPHMLNMAQHK